MYNGILNVYKEKDFTSHDVVAKLRGICKQKKIGHTGTLDPDATGVLPICLGKATKLCDMLDDTDKAYKVTLLLGVETDTEDMTGTILRESEVTCTEEEVKETIFSFLGDLEQIPPMYSAIKVNGKKLYELAREGKVIERKPRPVTIYAIEEVHISLPEISMVVRCSKGTYIRSLCRDIGAKLGCGGCMKDLVRIKACGFDLEHAYTLTQIEEMRDRDCLKDAIFPIDSAFSSYERVILPKEYQKFLLNGNVLPFQPESKEKKLRVYDFEGHFIGIYENKITKLKPIKLFFDFETTLK